MFRIKQTNKDNNNYLSTEGEVSHFLQQPGKDRATANLIRKAFSPHCQGVRVLIYTQMWVEDLQLIAFCHLILNLLREPSKLDTRR